MLTTENIDRLIASAPAPPPRGGPGAGRVGARPTPPSTTPPAAPTSGAASSDWLAGWISRHCPAAQGPSPWPHGDGTVGRRWEIPCPYSTEHTDGAFLGQTASGAIVAGCRHASCAGKGWREARSLLEGVEAVNPRAEMSPAVRELMHGSLHNLFHGKGRKPGDGSNEAYDWALLSKLIANGIDDPDELATAVARRPCYAVDPPTAEYLAGVVHRALARTDEAATTAAAYARTITGVRRYETHPPRWGFGVGGNEFTLTMCELRGPKTFEIRLGEHLGRVVRLGLKAGA